MAELEHIYGSKETGYFQSPREDLIELVNGTGLTVLDIGCGAGATGKRLLETGKAKWVTGVELIPAQAVTARQSLNQVLVGDIGQMKFDWPPGFFDCIIAGDVLEHLVSPDRILRELGQFLHADG
jgi:2-polyprenyl-3-methyl-5-hydroxy-6-metoxy-1,4-benzoquinol methylase